MKALFSVLLGGLALAACGDDTDGGGAGGAGGAGPGSGGGSTATTGSPASTSSSPASSSASGPGTGGDPGTGGAPGTGGDTSSGGAPGTGGGTGGSGTGGDGTGGDGGGDGSYCSDIVVITDTDDFCDLDPTAAVSDEGLATCTDLEETWLARFYRITVDAGDCVYMRADNVGSDGADIFGAIIDADGNNWFYADETACTDGEAVCPEGTLTVAAAGFAYIAVGAWEYDAGVCPAGTEVPYQVQVSVNGVDVDLSGTQTCEGDLNVIIQ